MLLILILNVQRVLGQELPGYLPEEGLIGWWPFNGNVLDESGNGFHAENYGASITTDRYETINRAYEFDGSGYLNISHNDSLNFSIKESYSISIWFLVNQNHNAGSLIEKWNGSGPYPYTIRVNNTGLDSHIAAVFQPSDMKIYFDGNLLVIDST